MKCNPSLRYEKNKSLRIRPAALPPPSAPTASPSAAAMPPAVNAHQSLLLPAQGVLRVRERHLWREHHRLLRLLRLLHHRHRPVQLRCARLRQRAAPAAPRAVRMPPGRMCTAPPIRRSMPLLLRLPATSPAAAAPVPAAELCGVVEHVPAQAPCPPVSR